ncbi:MAG: Gfo/Idh/MocA family oxidoreductase [Spirochaetota bacterium]
MNKKPFDVTIVGGGMITNDLLLPSIYQLKRDGLVKNINVCALNNPPLKALVENKENTEAFPGLSFNAYPSLSDDPKKNYPELYKEVIAKMEPHNAVVVAMPDQFHYDVVKVALTHDQHVLCVKPLVLKYEQAVELEHLAHEKGLFVGIEYHKRFDRRALITRREYERGRFGKFVIGEAKMIEPYYYRHSNFQNWFTCDKTDPFVYVGCHYVDLVYFITHLKPVAVSVTGVKGKFPNGNEGYLWANGRVTFENGAILNVTDGLGYPDEAAGSNEQGLVMYFESKDQCGYIRHGDQFRGVEHSYTDGKKFNYVNPDFYKLVPWEGDGYKPVGYGFDSVAAILGTVGIIRGAVDGMDAKKSLAERQRIIKDVDAKGIIATPANSSINELVVEAARQSILSDGDVVNITYGDRPQVKPRH